MRGLFSVKIYIYFNITFLILFVIDVKANEIDYRTLSDNDIVFLRIENLPDNTKCYLKETATGKITDYFGSGCTTNSQNDRTCKDNECWTTVHRIKKKLRKISCNVNNSTSQHTIPLNGFSYSLLKDKDHNCNYMLIPYDREEGASNDKKVDFVLINVPVSEECTLNGKKPSEDDKSHKLLKWNIIVDFNNYYSIQCKEKEDQINFDEELKTLSVIKNYQELKSKENNNNNMQFILLNTPYYEKQFCKIDSKLGQIDNEGDLRWQINQSQLESSKIYCGNRKGSLHLSTTRNYSDSSSTYQGLNYLKLPNYISINYKDNEAKSPFPDGTFFELKVSSWYTFWDTTHTFQLKNNNVIDKNVLNLFKTKYNLYTKDSFYLKIFNHPNLPEEIFQEYQFNSNIYSEIVFTLYPFAKVKRPYPSFNDKIVTFYPENHSIRCKCKIDYCYIWFSYSEPLKNYTMRVKGYNPLSLQMYSSSTDNVLELTKSVVQYVMLDLENNPEITDIEIFQTNKWEKLQKKKIGKGNYHYMLPLFLNFKSIKLRPSDSPKLKKIIDINKEQEVFLIDFGKLLRINLGSSNNGLQAQLIQRIEKKDKVLMNTISKEGKLFFRIDKTIDESTLFVKILNSQAEKFFDQIIQKYTDIVKKGGFMHLLEPNYFYLKFQGPRPEYYWFDGETDKSIDNDVIKLEWTRLGRKINLNTIRPSEYPDYNVTLNNFVLNKNKLKRIKDFDYPVYYVDIYQRKTFNIPQVLQINFKKSGWSIVPDYKKIEVSTEYDEKLIPQEGSGKSRKYILNECRNSTSDCSYNFYHTRKVKIKFNKANYQPIDKIIDMKVGQSITTCDLSLIPLTKKTYNLSIVDNMNDPIYVDAYYKFSDDNEWIKLNNSTIQKETYHDLVMDIHADGYQPKILKLNSSIKNSINIGDSNLPLWIIIEASTSIQQHWKKISENLVKVILRMNNDGKLNSNQVWLSFFQHSTLEEAIQLSISDEQTMNNKLLKRCCGPSDNFKLLERISVFPLKSKEYLLKKGFNLFVISNFTAQFLERDDKDQITDAALNDFTKKIKPFLNWINKKEIKESLSSVYLFELDFKRKGEKYTSTYGYLEKQLMSFPYIYYHRLIKPTDLKNYYFK